MKCSLKDDVTTNAGLQRAVDGVSKPGCLLWASMPCIGGSPRQHSNRHKLGGLEKLDAHIKYWYKIWTAFKVVARESIKDNGHIAVEWPSGCDYWGYHIVQEFFEELQLEKQSLTGVPLDSVVTTMILSENHGVSLPTMVIYSVPLQNIHVLVRINTLIVNHVQANIQRRQRAILGFSLM